MKLFANQSGIKLRIRLWLLFLLLLTIGTYLWITSKDNNVNKLFGGAPRQEPTSSPFLYANLGGMSVAIPSYFANYAEYDGGPGWAQVPAEEKPERNADSRLRAFGFDVRYPDMAGDSTAALVLEKLNQSPMENTWMSVTVTSGENYPGEDSLDNWVKGVLDTPNTIVPVDNYEKLSDQEHGLDVYVPAGIDPISALPYRQHQDAFDIFIQRNEAGKVVTVIRCSNRNVAAPPCNQFFSLEPKSHTNINVHYSRRLLAEWQNIQTSVSQLIYNFEVEE
jgi:hypothetical protein